MKENACNHCKFLFHGTWTGKAYCGAVQGLRSTFEVRKDEKYCELFEKLSIIGIIKRFILMT